MQGTITGGWGYIWAAYLITWGSLALYSLSLVWRDRKSAAEPPDEGTP